MTQADTGMFQIIDAAVAATLTPDFIEKQITSRVEKLITNVIDDSMRSYGDLGKQIEAAVKQALRVADLNLPSYGALVTQILEREIKAKAANLIEGQLVEDVDRLLALAPKEIKLSKIAEMMIERHGNERWGKVITVLVDESRYNSTWIYLDEDENRSLDDKYRCKHRILLRDDGTISSAMIDHTGSEAKWIGSGDWLGQLIRSWYACGTVIILDEDEVVTSVGDF
ncbi:MAG: hypothetical protein VYD90_10540 [Pseudomonadota bacterium]|nr:hypothetical protein [Pseudomonadota bacterium]